MSHAKELSTARISRRRLLAGAALGAVALAGGGRADAFAAVRQVSTPEPATSFLDSAVIHEISVSFDQVIYDAMIETFKETGDKEWIEATVSIDGSNYETSGIRLKGNSSLAGLGGKMPGLEQAAGTPPAGGPEGGDLEEHASEPVMVFRGGGGDGASADEPEKLPWLVRLDKYIDDQQHDGITELVIRSNPSETALNEVVSLELLGLAGLATQRAAAVRFSANDRAPVLRLAIEHPNDAWMAAHFSADGLLYKAEAGGDFSYRGDDPAAYSDIFDLEAGGTGDNAADMAPLFDFLDFLNNSDDETFSEQIPERLDLAGFVTYTSMMALLSNADDISGPGNNAYLYAAPGTGRMTVVPWDMNLSFGAIGGQNLIKEGAPEPPEGFEPPAGATPVAGQDQAGDGPTLWMNGEEGMRPFVPNILVERTAAISEFTALVDTTSSGLRAELYASGVAQGILDRWAGLLKDQASDLVDAATVDTESAAVAAFFSQEP